MRFLFIALLSFPTFANAQQILDEITADFSGDGIADFATLTQDDEVSATLHLYLGQPDGSFVLNTQAPALVWSGPAVSGQQPVLQVSPYGSLLVTAMNEAIGRDRWYETLTIAWRRGGFLIAGYTYQWYDTLNVENTGKCDINLLNGKGELLRGERMGKQTFSTNLRAMPVAEWSGKIPSECGL